MVLAATRTELEQLLADDVPFGDLTTDALGIGDCTFEMAFFARDAMVVAEAESAAAILEIAGCRVSLATSFRHRARGRRPDPHSSRSGVRTNRAGFSRTPCVSWLESISEAANRLQRLAPEKKLVIEVTSVEGAVKAADARFDVIQTEKFAPAQVAALSELLRAPPSSPRPEGSMPTMRQPMQGPAPTFLSLLRPISGDRATFR
jgi:nicotinate-nucleotide pyrophosphorylase